MHTFIPGPVVYSVRHCRRRRHRRIRSRKVNPRIDAPSSAAAVVESGGGGGGGCGEDATKRDSGGGARMRSGGAADPARLLLLPPVSFSSAALCHGGIELNLSLDESSILR